MQHALAAISRRRGSAPSSAIWRPPTRDPDNAEFLRGLLLLGGALFVLTLIAYLCTTQLDLAVPARQGDAGASAAIS